MGVALALTAVAVGVQVWGQQTSAKAQQVQLDLQKRQEKAAATDREVQRQRRLNAILGAQNAQIAASGVVNSGSVANVSMIDAKRAAEDSLVDRVNTSTKIAALTSESRAIRKVANIQSAGTILSAGQRYYDRNGNPFKKGGTPVPKTPPPAPSLSRY